VQGLILKFDAIARSATSVEQARHAIQETLDRADQVLAEARDRVRSLRRTTVPLDDLPAAFQRVAQEGTRAGGPRFTSVVEGKPRELNPVVLEETFSIGREALLNALAHSGGRNVELEITYDPRQFRLRIRDDGRGIDPEILDQGGRSDHWGLQGMRERAQKIGAELKLWSRPGAGTEAELTIPAAAAYVGSRAGAKRDWFRPSAGPS
jgi:signal transduction histidine kinase